MTRNQLDELIERGEGNRLEFKRSLSTPHRIARTLAAFANTSGGTLLIGVTDDRRIVGVASETREVGKLEEATDRLIDPALTISYEILTPDGRKVLAITVAESADKPHYVIDEIGRRTIYVRTRDKSVPTSKLIITPETADSDLLKTPMARTLIQHLRRNDDITAERFAKLVNVSDYRATKLLRQFAEKGLLLVINKTGPARYALKLTE